MQGERGCARVGGNRTGIRQAEGPREKEEREWPTPGRRVFGRVQRQVACSSNRNHPPEPLCKSGDG